MTQPDSEETLEKLVSSLSPDRKALLREMVEALSRNVIADINPDSDICTPAFAQNFQDRLSLYHAMNDEPLKKKTFEYAFVGASRAAGRTAVVNESPVNPGTDVVVDGAKYSLKTEASQGIDRDRITISKLMEARWIRECRTGGDFVRGTKTKICEHLKQYERIIMLRSFSVSRPCKGYEYHLVEIPLSNLMRVKDLTANNFLPRTPNGSSRADIFDGRRRLFSLRLDGSVEKITIAGLSVKGCMIHAVWIICL